MLIVSIVAIIEDVDTRKARDLRWRCSAVDQLGTERVQACTR